MQMGVVDAGDDGLAGSVDDFGIAACQSQDLIVRSNRFDDAVLSVNSLAEIASFHVDLTVDERKFFHEYTSRRPQPPLKMPGPKQFRTGRVVKKLI